MENLNLLLLFILFLLLFILLIKLFTKSKMNNINTLNNNISNQIDSLFKLKQKEKFEDYDSGYGNANKQLQEAAKNAKKKVPPPPSLSLPSSSVDCSECAKKCKNNNGDDDVLNTMMDNLVTLETKCHEYEEKQHAYDKTEKENHEEIVREQIKIENEKIGELKEIVNYYRKKYNEKLNINSQCRKQKQDIMEQNIEEASNIDPELLKKQERKIDINLSELLKKNKKK